MYVHITRLPTSFWRFSLAGKPYRLAVCDASRNFNGENSIRFLSPFAMTLRTCRFCFLALAPTIRAHRLLVEYAKRGLMRGIHAPLPITRFACFNRGSRFCAVAVAFGACGVNTMLNCFLKPCRRFWKRNFNTRLLVRSSRSSARPASPASGKHIKYVTEASYIIHVNSKPSLRKSAEARSRFALAELVILRALLLIAEHFIRLIDFFELLFITTLFIRVVLVSQLAIRLFYFVLSRSPNYAKRFIVVCGHTLSLFTVDYFSCFWFLIFRLCFFRFLFSLCRLLRRIHFLADFLRRLKQLFRCFFNCVTVCSCQRSFEHSYFVFYFFFGFWFHFISRFFERFFRRVCRLLSQVLNLDCFLFLFILFCKFLRICLHALNFLFRNAGRSFDADMLFFSRCLIFCRYI